jgi:hypothetical protein
MKNRGAILFCVKNPERAMIEFIELVPKAGQKEQAT